MLLMKTIGEYLMYGVAGLALVVGGCWWYAASGFDFHQVFMLILGLAFVAASVFLLWRDGKDELKRSRNASKEKKEWSKVARIRIALPFDELAVNFKELSKTTEEAVAEESYLSWNSGSFGDIRIQQLDAEAWMALFWVRSDWTLTDRQVEGICRRESVEMPSHFRKMQAHGVAVYRQGILSLYPAVHKEQLEDAFLTTVLQQSAAFKEWLDEYTTE
jgi:hypothetical protein